MSNKLNKNKKIICLAGIIILLLSFIIFVDTGKCFEFLAKYNLMYTTCDTEIKSEPNDNSVSIDYLIKDETVNVISNKDDAWVEILINDNRGFVKKECLTDIKPSFTLTNLHNQTMYIIKSAKLKKEPNIKSNANKTLMQYEKVTAIASVDDTNWYKVSQGNNIGYIDKTFLSINKPVFTITTMNKTWYCTTSNKLRVEPSFKADSKVQIMTREIVKVLAKVDGTNWYKVKCGNKTGYVYSKYYSSKKPSYTITAMNKTLYCVKETVIRDIPSTKYKKKGTIIPREAVKVVAKVNGKNYYKVKHNGKIGYVYSKKLSSKKPSYTITVMNKTMYCKKQVVVRNIPSKDYKKKDTITPNEKVKVIAKVNGKDYYKVKYNGKTGFVYSKYITNKKPKFTITKLDKIRYTLSKLNFRTGPGTNYKKITKIPFNTKVKVTGKVNGKNWYRIKYDGKIGYVNKDYLTSRKFNGYIVGSYKDGTAKITVYKEWYQNAWVYSAHLKFTNYKRFGTSCANGAYNNGYETTSHAHNRLGSILTVNGCYSAPYLDYGVVRSGKVCNDRTCWSPAVYSNKNGLLLPAWETGGTPGISGVQLSTLVRNGKVTDTFCFGPPFLNNNSITVGSGGSRAQRTFIGTNGNAGDIWICVSDGRYNDGESAGLTARQCAEYLKYKGCTFGVPLDGGGSSTIVWKGKTLNAAAGNERAVVDFVYFR